jgi:hypothetical protein
MTVMCSPGGSSSDVHAESAAAHSTPGTADPAARRDRHPLRRWPRSGWLGVAAWGLGLVVAFAANLRLSQTSATNSDGASQALQAWDMLHGNLLLHGWITGDVTYYTTEVPEYMLVELVHGLNADAVHIAAALTYTLAMLLVALLAMGKTTGREAVARAVIAAGIMIAPQLDAGTYALLNSPDHLGTSVPVLLAWLIVDRARPRWYVPVAVGLILAWAQIADMLVLYMAVVPLAIVCTFRARRAKVWQRQRQRQRQPQPLASQRYEIALAVAAVVAGVVGLAGPHVLQAIGGEIQVQPVTQLSPLNVIFWHNLRVTGICLLVLVGANFIGVHQAVRSGFEILHLAGAALGACAIAVAAWRFPRDRDLVSQLLLAGIVINLVAFAVGTHAVEITYTREITPVLPFAAALAGRLLARRLLAMRLAPVLIVVLCGYLAGLVFAIRQPVVPAQNARLTSWLETHHLHYGLSGYWAANAVTLTSGERVKVRSLDRAGATLRATRQLVNTEWYDPSRESANFVVVYDGHAGTQPFTGFTGVVGFPDTKEVIATFGTPARTYRYSQYTIFVWDKNLLTVLPGP